MFGSAERIRSCECDLRFMNLGTGFSKMNFDFDNLKIAVIGLGYVGLPLAVELSKKYAVVGFDIDSNRISELRRGYDKTLEVSPTELENAEALVFTDTLDALSSANFFVVTVPTPIDASKRPDLSALKGASACVAGKLKSGDIVVYESTVYPGATEEDCVPILEKISGLKLNRDFFVGYSPERMSPGDKVHSLKNTIKLTSGSTEEAADFIDRVYSSIVDAGTYKAESIRVAEAAKVIENTQRDINIAIVNEFSKIFNHLQIDTEAVLAAAGTKWNFMPFRPGLVGGHCIGVDPYYLTHKAEEGGYHPEVTLAGRRINDKMGSYIADQMVKAMIGKGIQIKGSRVLIMGLTFKENCPDLRNTRVVDVVSRLQEFGVEVEVCDPWADRGQALAELDLQISDQPQGLDYDGIVVTVAHSEFREMGAQGIKKLAKNPSVFYDVKSVFARLDSDLRL